MKAIKLERGRQRGSAQDGFAIEILYPGLALRKGDSGIGAIGRIDRALVQGGHVIGMHPHRDDEILTYVRTGAMRHRDSMGHAEKVTATRLMMMNAGHTFQHEEEILKPGPSTALQIFLRPHAADLEPRVQFHEFGAVRSENAWRLLAAPDRAPLTVRGQAWVQDAHVPEGDRLLLPPLPAASAVRLLYVFSGTARMGDLVIRVGESVYLGDASPATVEAVTDTDLVLFTTDPSAAVFKGGMFSGNLLSAS